MYIGRGSREPAADSSTDNYGQYAFLEASRLVYHAPAICKQTHLDPAFKFRSGFIHTDIFTPYANRWSSTIDRLTPKPASYSNNAGQLILEFTIGRRRIGTLHTNVLHIILILSSEYIYIYIGTMKYRIFFSNVILYCYRAWTGSRCRNFYILKIFVWILRLVRGRVSTTAQQRRVKKTVYTSKPPHYWATNTD